MQIVSLDECLCPAKIESLMINIDKPNLTFSVQQLCLDRNVKRNIKKFKGYEWTIGSSDYKAKLEETAKMEMKQLRTMCEMLDLDKKGIYWIPG